MDNIEKIKVGSTTYPVGLRNLYMSDKGNLSLETSTDMGNHKKADGSVGKGKINIESMDDIQIKPGDDVILYSHKRGDLNKTAATDESKREVSVKIMNGEGTDDIPVKLQVNASEITLTTKDKDLNTFSGYSSSDNEVMDITVNKAKGTRGYLKLRARAIDLRCEDHGGIALQPKGNDSDGNMNKIKFEHGGGDGLEFGTFNTDKTSLFTKEYRFNKAGKVIMATRSKIDSPKKDKNNNLNDPTAQQVYVKQSDDFYDIIDENDKKTTWEGIILAGNAFEKGNLDVSDCPNVVAEYKLTKNGEITGGDPTIEYIENNNYGDSSAIEGWTGPNTKTTNTISCKLSDIIKLVNWMKTNNQGPWSA